MYCYCYCVIVISLNMIIIIVIIIIGFASQPSRFNVGRQIAAGPDL